jgi:acetyl esterase/lipase
MSLPLKLFCIIFFSLSLRAQQTNKIILVHYMPWYATKDVSGAWGFHWTMNRFDPEKIGKDKQREIASHDYPLIGPYDSNDPCALECHVLLMKLAGIDGVIIDWYGVSDFWDYGMLHRNTQHVLQYVKKAGLKYAICYEDQSIKHKVNNGRIKKEEDIEEARKDMKWLDSQCFNDSSYVKLDGRPILPVFGPQYFSGPQWNQLVSELGKRPILYGVAHQPQNGMDGLFGWPPVEGGKEIAHEKWMTYLQDLQTRTNYLAVAFPGFHDIYPKSYGTIDAQKGKTFEETFDLAQKGKSPIIQVVTWNDYGEGTVVEPTRQMSYRYLEHIQKSATSRIGYTPDDMRLPVRLYEARKKYAKDASVSNRLEHASQLLFAGKCKDARGVLESLGKRSVVTNLYYTASSNDAYRMERCKVDVSSPVGATNLPVLVFFHGGGLTSGNRHFPKVNRDEMVVVTAGYRLSPQATYPAFVEDAAAAVAWTFQHAQQYGGDPKKIFVSGHSAGGYLTAMIGMDPRWLKPYGFSPNDLAGLIPISAQVTTHFNVKKMLKIEGEQYRPLITPEAPLYYCSSNLPPICIITGDRKIEWPCRVEENELMAASLRALKHPYIEFHELPGKNHGTVASGVDEIIRQFMAR